VHVYNNNNIIIIDPKRKPQFGFRSVLYNFRLSITFSLPHSVSVSPSHCFSVYLSLSPSLRFSLIGWRWRTRAVSEDCRLPAKTDGAQSRKIIEYYYEHTRADLPVYIIWRRRKIVNTAATECETRICINTVTGERTLYIGTRILYIIYYYVCDNACA